MIDKIIYIILGMLSITFYFILEKNLRKNYFKSEANYLGGIFGLAILIAPNKFLKKNKILRGYLLYILHLFLFGLAIFLTLKIFLT